MKKLNKGSIRSLVVVLGVISLTAISCGQADKSQPNQSEADKSQPNKSGIESQDSKPSSISRSEKANSIPPVTGLKATASAPHVVNLSWDSVPNATTYWIYRPPYVPAIITNTKYTDRSVRADTTYTYAIAAVVNSTLGPKSKSVTVKTPRR